MDKLRSREGIRLAQTQWAMRALLEPEPVPDHQPAGATFWGPPGQPKEWVATEGRNSSRKGQLDSLKSGSSLGINRTAGSPLVILTRSLSQRFCWSGVKLGFPSALELLTPVPIRKQAAVTSGEAAGGWSEASPGTRPVLFFLGWGNCSGLARGVQVPTCWELTWAGARQTMYTQCLWWVVPMPTLPMPGRPPSPRTPHQLVPGRQEEPRRAS